MEKCMFPSIGTLAKWANNRKQSEIFSVPCFAVYATLPQNNPLQIFRCCGR